MRSIKSAVITGSTGTIGQALCRLLISKDITVYAVCRPDSPRTALLPNHSRLHIVSCDIKNLDNLPTIIDEKAEVFFHFAWAGNDGNNRNNMRLQTQNIQYALDACYAAQELGCKLFVGAGSQAEYGLANHILTPDTPCFPENGYGMAKLCAGQMTKTECQSLGLNHIWPRFLSVYGPYEQLSSMTISTIMKLLKGETPGLTAGTQVWDYLYCGDAAEALYQMAVNGKDGAIYTLGGGSARPLKEYVEIMRDEINPTLKVDFGAVPYTAKQIMYLEADISALTADTGFVPYTDFRAGIKKTIEWVKGIVQ